VFRIDVTSVSKIAATLTFDFIDGLGLVAFLSAAKTTRSKLSPYSDFGILSITNK
jgi:hypothetical protein